MRWGKAGWRAQIAPSAWTHPAQGITIEGRVGLSRRPALPQAPVIADLDDTEALGARVQCRICPSPRPFGLFAAEGVDQDPEARRVGQGGPPAGASADRHR